MGEKLGIECKLYYGAAGATATTELTNTKDVTLNLEKGEADNTRRSSGGWESIKAVLKSASLEFDMVWDPGDGGFAAIKDAYFNNTPIALTALDAEGGEGLDADWEILKFSRSEPLKDIVSVSVSAKPNTVNRVPAWITP